MMKGKRKISLLLAFALLLSVCAAAAAADFDVDAYLAEREKLLVRDWVDSDLSDQERAVDALLLSMKQEADSLYTGEYGYGLIAGGVSEAVESDLYAFCRALPKGGDLHVHDCTMIPFDTLLDLLIDYPGTFICLEEGAQYANLYVSGSNMPENTVSLKQALEDGSVTRDKIREAYRLHAGMTPRQAWDQFSVFFTKLGGLKSEQDMVEQIYTAGFQSCVDNGILLVELKLWFTVNDDTNRALLNTVKNAYFTVKKDNPAFTVRVIGSNNKRDIYPFEEAIDGLRSAIRLSREIMDDFDPMSVYPFIIGLDLAGEEDAGRPMSDYAEFFMSDEVLGSGLQLFLHCGESLRFDNDSVLDAFLFGAQRLGHAFNLYRYPKVQELLAERGTAIEVCPVSNCLLGYAHDLRLHPGQNYFHEKIPIVLCSDDALYLEDDPLTEDYFAVILAWDLSIAEIRALSENAILYSGLTPVEINALHAEWQAQWDAFIKEWSQKNDLQNAA